MQKPKSPFFFLLLTVFLVACQSSIDEVPVEEVKIPTFEERDYSRVPINGIDSFYASRIYLDAKHLLLQDWVPYQRLHLVELGSNRLLNSIGSKNGPSRLSRDLICNGQFIEKEDTVFSFFKSNKRGLFKLKMNDYAYADELNYAPLNYPAETFVDKIYLSNPDSANSSPQIAYYADEQSILQFDPIKDQTHLKKINGFKRKRIVTDKLIAANIYGNTNAYNTNTSELYIAYYYFNHIDLINSNLELFRRIYFGTPHLALPELDEEGYPAQENTFYFGHITSSFNKICLLYFNTPFSTIENVKKSKIIILDRNTLESYGIQVNLQISHMQLSTDGKELYFLGETDQFPQNLFKVKLWKKPFSFFQFY